MVRLLFISMILSSFQILGQTTVSWSQLAEVDLTEGYVRSEEAWKLLPKFDPSISGLKGKKIRITGYIIPLDVEGVYFALSAFPFSSCFFCGGAGPETVMSIHFKDIPREYNVDEVVTLEGTFDPGMKRGQDFIYYLRDVEEVR